MDKKKSSNAWYYLKEFFIFVKPYKKPLRIVYLLHLTNSILNLLTAYSIRYFIDLFIMGNSVTLFGKIIMPVAQDIPIKSKIILSLFFLAGAYGMIVIANAVGVLMWRFGTRNVQKVLLDIKNKINNHINKLHLGYFHSERVGAIMTKALGDVEQLNMLLSNSFFITYGLVQLIMAPFLMISMSPLLFLFVFVPMPLLLYSLYNLRYKMKPIYRDMRETSAVINSQMQENISGIKEIKAFNIEDFSEDIYRRKTWDMYKLHMKMMKIFSLNHQLQYGSKDIGSISLVVGGGILMYLGIGHITPGIITSMLLLTNFMYQPINQIFGFYNVIQKGMVSLERIIDFLKEKPDIKDSSDAVTLTKDSCRGNIFFNDVTFSYNGKDNVLENISFEAKPGEKIAVVGATGSGKSTLLSLLMRFYDVNEGSILLDGKDIRSFTQVSLRKHMGIVFQDTFLFYGTIWENLTFVNSDKTKQDIINACKAANVYETIMNLPDRFDTIVGERGVKLSGGQKQRLSIARVILKDPKVVILDEATSAVDTVTERAIQASIDHMLSGRTAFIIAHRLSTIRDCDKIIVLEGKNIAEIGSHNALLEKNGLYSNLCENSSV
jgi:ABC-type multidrug transport system fused ATPase/permease subunit